MRARTHSAPSGLPAPFPPGAVRDHAGYGASPSSARAKQHENKPHEMWCDDDVSVNEKLCVCVCVCVCERERESEIEREREREREKEKVN